MIRLHSLVSLRTYSHPCVNKENGKTPSKEKTAYRKCWEVYHGASGFITVAIGFGQVGLLQLALASGWYAVLEYWQIQNFSLPS